MQPTICVSSGGGDLPVCLDRAQDRLPFFSVERGSQRSRRGINFCPFYPRRYCISLAIVTVFTLAPYRLPRLIADVYPPFICSYGLLADNSLKRIVFDLHVV